jgi:hypothetical protein
METQRSVEPLADQCAEPRALCKNCDIEDPAQNDVWVTPERGGDPNYPNR